jgi:hypothetical protein
MTNPTECAERYIALWNETDPAARRARVAELFAPEAHFADPVAEGQGHDGIDAVLGGVQQRFAGHRFAQLGSADGFGSHVRLSWQLAAGGAPPVVRGTDILLISPEGLIQSVVGFFDAVAIPATASAAAS